MRTLHRLFARVIVPRTVKQPTAKTLRGKGHETLQTPSASLSNSTNVPSAVVLNQCTLPVICTVFPASPVLSD
jgi:hypothetical protein